MTAPADTPTAPIPPDDPDRSLAVARPGADDDGLPHVAVAGGVYTVLISGQDTAGRFTLIEMRVPPGGGPPPHRHDFEETFSLLEGELEFTFRGESTVVRAGETINVPANAPHAFRNVSGGAARMHCICSPAGQDEFFLLVGDRVERRDSAPPALNADERAARGAKAAELASRFRTELLVP